MMIDYSRHNENVENEDFDEQRKIAEGADALLNLAGVCTTITQDHHYLENNEEDVPYNNALHRYISEKNQFDLVSATKIRPSNDGPNKRRKRPWGDTFIENVRYMKQVRG